MSRSTVAIAVLTLMLVAGPLFGQSVQTPAEPKELSSVTLPPDLDRVLRDYERAWHAGDASAIASLFAEDGFLLQDNRLPIRGRSAIRTNYEGQKGGPLLLRAFAFSTSDTLGYIIGAYGTSNASGDIGKFTLTLRRTPDGPWLIFSDMDSINAQPQH